MRRMYQAVAFAAALLSATVSAAPSDDMVIMGLSMERHAVRALEDVKASFDTEGELRSTSLSTLSRKIKELQFRTKSLYNLSHATPRRREITDELNRYGKIYNSEIDRRKGGRNVSAPKERRNPYARNQKPRDMSNNPDYGLVRLKMMKAHADRMSGSNHTYSYMSGNPDNYKHFKPLPYSKFKEVIDAYPGLATSNLAKELEHHFNVYMPGEWTVGFKEYLRNRYPNPTANDIQFIEDELKAGYIAALTIYFSPSSAHVVDDIVQVLRDQKGSAVQAKKTDFRNRRPYSSVSRDRRVLAVIKRDHKVRWYGPTKRRRIVSSWFITKNGLGVPLYQHVNVEVITKKGKKCTLNAGRIVRQYIGGGRYGGMYLADYKSSLPMRCANIDKTIR